MTSAAGDKSAGERRRERRLSEIAEAARNLFGMRGYEETSLAEIADAVDLSPKALYYYFDSKRAILETILVEGFVYFEPARLSAVRAEWTGLDLRDALVASSLAAVEEIVGHADLLRLSFSETFRGDAVTRSRHEEYMASWADHVIAIFDEKAAKNQVKPALRRPLAETIVETLLGLSVDSVLRGRDHAWSRSDGAAARRRFVETLIDTTLSGAVGG